jgi:hypothetical protein
MNQVLKSSKRMLYGGKRRSKKREEPEDGDHSVL